MTKTKTPFLSLGAKGSVGNTITAQKHGSATSVRSKPRPTDPYSLPQAYQRWLYEDYAYLWTQQSDATRALYRSAGVRFHLTAFQYWMKYQLTHLPDIAGLWHLDEKAGAVAYDYSRNGNNGILKGVTPADGAIAGGQYHDGINDWVDLRAAPAHSKLVFSDTDPWTFEHWIEVNQTDHRQMYAGRFHSNEAFLCQFDAADISYRFRNRTGAYRTYLADASAYLNTLTHITWRADGAGNLALFINGDLIYQRDELTQMTFDALGLGYSSITMTFKGILDHSIVYLRGLDETEIKRHSGRRYPA